MTGNLLNCSRIRSFLPVCLGVLLIALLAGCQPAEKTAFSGGTQMKPTFPTGEELRPGDILLGRSYGMVGALFARFGATPGPYSHAALYFENEDGTGRIINFRPFGMEECSPEAYLSRYGRVALVRCDKPVDGTRLGAAARRWLARNAEKPVEPDYMMNRSDHEKLFCLELVSVIYQECGLPDPFTKAYRVDDHPIAPLVMQDFNMNIREIPSPNALLHAPDFTVLAEYTKPEYDPRDDILNETILETMEAYYADGLTVQPPRFGGKVKIWMLLSMFHVKRLLTPNRQHPSIPGFVGQRAIETGYMFYQHVSLSKKLAREWFTEVGEDWTPKEIKELSRKASDTYRDHFFMPRPDEEKTEEQIASTSPAHP